jgi:hypothetical protein
MSTVLEGLDTARQPYLGLHGIMMIAMLSELLSPLKDFSGKRECQILKVNGRN